MNPTLRIHFITDLTDPWCRIAQTSLDIALGWIGSDVECEVCYEPCELHPTLPRGGRKATDYFSEALGLTPEQQKTERAEVCAFAEPYGLDYLRNPPVAIYNTFDAHRLLRWAYDEGQYGQRNLHIALLNSYHRQHLAIDDRHVLLQTAVVAYLNVARAAEVLDSDAYAGWVRGRSDEFREFGAPFFVVNDKHVFHGTIAPDELERKLRDICGSEQERVRV
jgi:predicted DsbA family dithiol-disulfide isomerase